MIRDIHIPIELTADELDDYLARGWFRMGQTIFTTDFIPVGENIYPVYWLRVILKRVHYGRKQKKLLLSNKDFTIAIKPFEVTAELEELYTTYKTIIDFEAPLSLEDHLMNGLPESIYHTQLIEIRDAGLLIAAGIFDEGNDSIAGIMNFYHPDYKAYSPGKYLMLLKINHALEAGRTYYYPGYIASGYSKFDYKLFPDINAMEIYDPAREEWIPYKAGSLPEIARIEWENEEDDEKE